MSMYSSGRTIDQRNILIVRKVPTTLQRCLNKLLRNNEKTVRLMKTLYEVNEYVFQIADSNLSA